MVFLFFLFLPLFCLGMEVPRGHRSGPTCSRELKPGPFILDPMWCLKDGTGDRAIIPQSALKLAKLFIPQMEALEMHKRAFREAPCYDVMLPVELKDISPIYVAGLLQALYNCSFRPKEEEKEKLHLLAEVLKIEALQYYLDKSS